MGRRTDTTMSPVNMPRVRISAGSRMTANRSSCRAASSSRAVAATAQTDLLITIMGALYKGLIASAVLSWLVAFNVVNTRNPIVANLGEFLYRITEPALRPIRSMLPNLGGIDVSPVILIIGLLFLKQFIFWVYIKLFV